MNIINCRIDIVVQRAQHFIGEHIHKVCTGKSARKSQICDKEERSYFKVLPEFAEIFKNSKNISLQKGRSHFLIKKFGKRKWGEIKDDYREKLKKVKEKVLELNKEVEMMELQIECFKEMVEKYYANNAEIEKLYNDNIIDSDGEIRT